MTQRGTGFEKRLQSRQLPATFYVVLECGGRGLAAHAALGKGELHSVFTIRGLVTHFPFEPAASRSRLRLSGLAAAFCQARLSIQF